MSDSSSGASTTGGTSPGSRKTGKLILRVVMVALLVLLGSALAYDYLIALPQSNENLNSLNEFLDENSTRDDVHAELGKGELVEKSGTIIVEKYQWTRGLLLTSYTNYVSYTLNEEGEWAIHKVARDDPSQIK